MNGPCLLIGIALLLAAAAPTRSAEAPPLPPEHKLLDQWTGTWRETYTWSAGDGPEKPGTSDLVMSSVLDGRFLQGHSSHSDGSTAILMFTYDAEKKCYRAWTFHSEGVTNEATGHWDPASRTMSWTFAGPLESTLRQRFLDDDRIAFEVNVKDKDGKPFFRMAGESVRVKKPQE